MKSRVTLTLEPGISYRARAVARERGTSLSGLVEQLLAREAGGVIAEKALPFHRKWAGKLKIVAQSDPRFDHLKKKHDL